MQPSTPTFDLAVSTDPEVLTHARTYVVETLRERYLVDGGAVTRYARRPQWASDVDGVPLALTGRPVAMVDHPARVPVVMPSGRAATRVGSVVLAVRAVAL